MTSPFELGAALGWLARLRARRRLEREVSVWYHPAYAAPGMGATARVPSLDPARGETVIALLAAEGLLRPGEVRAAPAASLDELGLFHPLAHLERVATAGELGRIFGLDPEAVDVDRVLAAQRRAVGGTIAAARTVLAERRRVAVNLGGGFHHAEHDRGAGFCVYNDVAVAVAVLRREGFHGRVAIVDLDFHQGDGNLAAFAADASVLDYSIHGVVWSHREGAASRQLLLPAGVGDAAYLDLLRSSLGPALEDHRPALVFYIAGNDVLRGDRLGTFRLSPSGVLERDRHVLAVAEALGAPLVVTLGGGYGAEAWPATANLLRFVLTGDPRARAARPPLRAHYERVARALDPAELQRDDALLEGPLLSPADLDEVFGPRRPHRRVLDFYSAHGVELAFERYGVLAKLRARGFGDLRLEVDPSDPARQLVRLRARRGGGGPEQLLLELVVARAARALPSLGLAARGGASDGPGEAPSTVSLLSIEWLLLQDPTASFTLDRPPLPGQTHPGLGIAEEVKELLLQACRRTGLEGLLDRPARYHNAAGALDFRFLDPRVEGGFRAMLEVLAPLHRADAARRVDEDGLELADGTPVLWTPADHVLAVGARLAGYLGSLEYRAAVEAERARVLAAGLRAPSRAADGG